MQDEPTPDEILESVAALLRDTLPAKLPAREAFDARVAANALDLVRRQLSRASQRHDDTERARLASLLGQDAALPELNRLLCARIASGELGLSNPDFMEHLWITTLDKLAVDQPTYASYRQALAERGD
jgi:Domain of unknown function (DUF6285)